MTHKWICHCCGRPGRTRFHCYKLRRFNNPAHQNRKGIVPRFKPRKMEWRVKESFKYCVAFTTVHTANSEGTIDFGVWYLFHTTAALVGYCDADWA
ncbi:uncharacterized protein E5676_scaffold244G00160 [Cucumis melo var. makuwa]|uniref:Uncharacterized protein n=1 Tax=Cucumis melo var. makuwa TaxID=1194695 RepID=A0A5D3DUC1_CUCMM|nr:uncharacterized protein E6C27_scaffold13G002120 [Cucumis melo var. makuwa]TYK27253.1 uncharacterized protein E5676_scaffold244G00160 [Cucumis melo var. makuwa]